MRFPSQRGNLSWMSGNETIPERLYKYRAFGERTLAMLVGDELHFADPATFNDPLDARPYVEIDVEESVLETVLRRLVRQRVAEERQRAGGGAPAGSDDGDVDVEEAGRRKADDVLADIEYHAKNPDYDDAVASKCYLYRERITEELLRRYGTGIVSLAERPDCPLMWSHYGDQHRGICIGYSVPAEVGGAVRKVRYEGSRMIAASTVAAMLEGDEAAGREVDEAVLLRKAGSWEYEREWRLLGTRGLNGSLLELEEIVFGMRCGQAVKYAVMKALECRKPQPCFRELREERGSFDLRTTPLGYDDEMFRNFPTRYLTIIEGFGPIRQ